MTAAPALPLFGDAYLADTRHLSLEEHGAYLQLMMIAWRTEGCFLPDDDARLAQMLGVTKGRWGKIKPAVMAFWALADGEWKQKRLERERNYVEKNRDKKREAARVRWGHDAEKQQDTSCTRISKRNAPLPPPTTVAKATVPAVLKIEEVGNKWNAMASRTGLAKVKAYSAERRRAFKARLAEHGAEAFDQAIAAVERSSFCTGKRGDWKADFGFMLRPERFVKLIEGGFDDPGSVAAKQSRASELSPHKQAEWDALLASGMSHTSSEFYHRREAIFGNRPRTNGTAQPVAEVTAAQFAELRSKMEGAPQ